jgi:hypothetical protein
VVRSRSVGVISVGSWVSRIVLEVAEADLETSGRLGQCERRRQACRRSLADANDRLSGLHHSGVRRVRAPGCTELIVGRGPRVRIHLPPAKSQVRTRAGVQTLIVILDNHKLSAKLLLLQDVAPRL